MICGFHCTGQSHIPASENEKDELRSAGLGSKDITLCIDANYEEFQAAILDTFPRLKDGGGYRFLKGNITTLTITVIILLSGIANSKTLTLLSLYCHKSPRHLKESVGKRTYIRPVQRDLDLTPVHASDDEEVCQ